MPVFVIGINHHSAPLELREKLAFPQERQADALADLAAQPGIAEAVLVSTCNRTEVYCRADDPRAASAWLNAEGAKAALSLERHLYCHADEAAVRHAFRVASGLDSMVLGEPQILGQVKQSVRAAEHLGTLGQALGGLFQKTFAVAKEVRGETSLGAQSISMAAAALKLAQNLFGDLSRTRMLLIGVGEMVELAATYFVAQRPERVVVANRTLARGEEFAARFGARAISLEDLPARLAEFDVVITGTASTLPILGKGMLERALKARRRRPIFIADFAVPRDVEAEAATLAGPAPGRRRRARGARARHRDALPARRRARSRRGVMKQSMNAKLASLAARLGEIDRRLADPDVVRNLDDLRKLSQERAEILPVVEAFGNYRKAKADLGAAEEMARDPPMKAYAEQESRP